MRQHTISNPLADEYAARNPATNKRTLIIILSVVGGVVVLCIAILCLIFVIFTLWIGTNPNIMHNFTEPTVTQPPFFAPMPALVGTKQYSSAPPMLIDVKKQYFATVKMAKGGEFVIQLYPDKAPIPVNNFVFLARQGFFDGITFHRVLKGFIAQGGDPTGTGAGGPGYEFANEENNLAFDKAGVVAMANSGPNTNGSQFFISFGPLDLSESDYPIFGQVISGMDVVNSITRRDPQLNPNFLGDAIDTIIITEK